ncbi:MAG: FkbM family methyltransferase [Pseudobdellovibrionaceae bacterium]|nr:FkbM family methyltransferase [Pseudobdellovibrionaceae bacterium]
MKKVIRNTACLGARALNFAFSKAVTIHGDAYVTPPDMNPIDYISLVLGRYERAELGMLKSHFQNASNIIEVGANIGVLTRAAFDTKLLDGGRMICLEPNPDSQSSLIGNVLTRTRNSLRDRRIEFLQYALCAPSNEGEAIFIQRNDLSSGLVGQVERNPTDRSHIPVTTISLSSLLKQKNVSGTYSLICDAEGAEIPMMYEDGDALRNCDQILIELHHPDLTGQPITPDDMVGRLKTLGFHLKDRDTNTYYLDRVPA